MQQYGHPRGGLHLLRLESLRRLPAETQAPPERAHRLHALGHGQAARVVGNNRAAPVDGRALVTYASASDPTARAARPEEVSPLPGPPALAIPPTALDSSDADGRPLGGLPTQAPTPGRHPPPRQRFPPVLARVGPLCFCAPLAFGALSF